MSQSHPRPGMYAWDERDSRSIARHTVTYRGSFGLPPEPPRVAHSILPGSRTAGRLASMLLARLRPGSGRSAESSQAAVG